jgi:hypothetical protein
VLEWWRRWCSSSRGCFAITIHTPALAMISERIPAFARSLRACSRACSTSRSANTHRERFRSVDMPPLTSPEL